MKGRSYRILSSGKPEKVQDLLDQPTLMNKVEMNLTLSSSELSEALYFVMQQIGR
jgi:hypothetical protein